MKNISTFPKFDLIRGLRKINLDKYSICGAYIKGKQVKNSFHSKNTISTYKTLEILHTDLFGHVKTSGLSGEI